MSRTLTKVLLKRDFGLEWDMPDSHLVPGLTGRINYINWIQEVLNLVPHPGGCSGKMEGVSADATAEERTTSEWSICRHNYGQGSTYIC